MFKMYGCRKILINIINTFFKVLFYFKMYLSLNKLFRCKLIRNKNCLPTFYSHVIV